MKAFKSVKDGIFFFSFLMLFVGCSNKESYQPQTHMVEIISMKFKPADLKVHKGDTVVWINKDLVDHDVTEVNKAWASPRLVSGSSWKKVITKSDNYFCAWSKS
jgi:plastocyanin